MGTSNFANVNASRIFAVELEEEWDYENLKYNLISGLEQLPYTLRRLDKSDNSRSYPGTIVGSLLHTFRTGGVDVDIEVKCIIRSGYYSGCNLDWEDEIDVDGNTIFDWEKDIHDAIEYASNPGLAKMISHHCYKRVLKELDTMTAAIEKVYEECSTPLKVVAQFSNGETMYEKA